MNRAILVGSVIVGIAVMMSISFITPAFAVKELDCKEGHNVRYRCFGGQPVLGDSVTYKRLSGLICTGEVSFVINFDSDKDRKGTMNVTFISNCPGGKTIGGFVMIVGKL